MQVGSNNMNPGGRSGSHQGGLTLGQKYLGGRGSMDSINTHSSDLSFGSAGSFYSSKNFWRLKKSSRRVACTQKY